MTPLCSNVVYFVINEEDHQLLEQDDVLVQLSSRIQEDTETHCFASKNQDNLIYKKKCIIFEYFERNLIKLSWIELTGAIFSDGISILLAY